MRFYFTNRAMALWCYYTIVVPTGYRGSVGPWGTGWIVRTKELEA